MNIKKLKVNRDPIEKALAGAGVTLAVGLGLAGIVYGMEQSDELKMKTSSNSKQSTTQEDSTELNTWYTFGHIQEDGSKLLMQLSKDEVSDVYLDENGFPVIFNTSRVDENTGEVMNLLTGRDVDLTSCTKQDSFFDYLEDGDIHVSSTTLWNGGREYCFEGDRILMDLADVFDYNITTERTVNEDGSVTITQRMEVPVILTESVDGPLYGTDGNVIEQSSDAKTKVK